MAIARNFIRETAFSLVASDYLNFEDGSAYDQNAYLGWVAFDEAVSANPDLEDMPEGIEITQRNKHDSPALTQEMILGAAMVVERVLLQVLDAAKSGIVVSVIDSALPDDYNDLDMATLCQIGHVENESVSMLDELYQLTQIEYDADPGLTEAQSKRYVELWQNLKDNDIDIPFGVEI